MTICKGTSPTDGRETVVLVLEHVTPAQLKAIEVLLEKECTRLWDAHGDEALSVQTYVSEETEILMHGLINLMADLDVEGYEMS